MFDMIVALHHMQHWHLLALDGEHAVSIPGTGGGGIPVIEYNRYMLASSSSHRRVWSGCEPALAGARAHAA